MAGVDEATGSGGYEGRRRRRVGLGERLRGIPPLAVLAVVMVTAVALTVVVKTLDSPSESKAGPPAYAQPAPTATDGIPTAPHAGATSSPDGTPSPPVTPSPTAKPSASVPATPTPATTPSSAPSPPSPPQTVRYEAENATISQGVVASNHAGYSGSGFVDYTNVAGGYLQWTVNVPAAGNATLRLRFANGAGDARPMDVIVNGAAVTAAAFDGTGAWNNWATRTLTIPLNQGANTIRALATSANGGPNVDHIEIQQ
jgi:hypothetical protein